MVLLEGSLEDPLQGFFHDISSGTNECQSALELVIQLNDQSRTLYEIEEDILPHKVHQDYFEGCKPFEGDMVQVYRDFFAKKIERIEKIRRYTSEIEKIVD